MMVLVVVMDVVLVLGIVLYILIERSDTMVMLAIVVVVVLVLGIVLHILLGSSDTLTLSWWYLLW